MTHQDAVWIVRNGEGAIVAAMLRMDSQLQSALEHNKYLQEQLSGWNPEIPNKTPPCICATLPHRYDCPMANDKLFPLSSNTTALRPAPTGTQEPLVGQGVNDGR